MKRIALAAVLAAALAIGACGSDDEESEKTQRNSPRTSWGLVEDLLAKTTGWNAELAHQARLEAEMAGQTAQEGDRCWSGRQLPGEWPKGCEFWADFERTHGVVERGRQELNRPEPKPQKEKPSVSGGFTGEDAEHYDQAHFTCSSFPKTKVARDLGLPESADVFDIAEEYASGFQEYVRQPNFEGCLDALLER